MTDQVFNAAEFLREIDAYRPRKQIRFDSERSLDPLVFAISCLRAEIEKLKIVKTAAQKVWRHPGAQPGSSKLATVVTRCGPRSLVFTSRSR
jgi:hypothetical protein